MQVPFTITGPLIALVCVIGAWTVAGSPFDLWLLLGFGIVGYVMKSLDYPLAPLVLAMVLGDRTEDAFRQSMMLSQGSPAIFFANGLVTTITLLALFCLSVPLIGLLRRRRTEPLASAMR
jgi:TctA family transporter